MKTRCLIVDDEPLAIQLLQDHLSQLETFEVTATAGNAIKALETLKNKEIDLLFCDIKMPTLTGFDLLKTLKNPPKTIITTAHREFALDGYEYDIVDYLLKPITFERFFKAIEKYLNQHTPKPPKALAQPSNTLTFKSNNTFYRVLAKDILYIESQKDYARLVLKTQEIKVKYKISDLEDQLTTLGFLRIHRSFLVNQQHIVSYSAIHIQVGSHELPIGAGYRELVMASLKI
jgi:two-component system, LytTR family, response regulator